jgi:predicted Zn-dependent protease
MNTRLRPAAVVLLACLAFACLPGCVTNPATGSRQLNYLSIEEEVRIGEESMPQVIDAYGGRLPNEHIQRYVSDMGQDIAATVEPRYRDLPWEFVVLDSEIINAFALPGGKVFVSRGLLEAFETEAQLAGVLGHEVGHVTAEHHDLAMQRQLTLAGIAVGAGVLTQESDSEWVRIASQAVVTGSGIFALTYSRDQERESDDLGLRYMTRAGYDPRGLEQAMRILDQASGGQGPPEWLSTHPNPGSRAERLEELIQNNYAAEADDPSRIVGEEAYRRNVLGRL